LLSNEILSIHLLKKTKICTFHADLYFGLIGTMRFLKANPIPYIRRPFWCMHMHWCVNR